MKKLVLFATVLLFATFWFGIFCYAASSSDVPSVPLEAEGLLLPEIDGPIDRDPLEETEEILGEEVLETQAGFEVGPEGYIEVIDIQDADIRTVLRMFSKRCNINVVCSPAVQGMVNIRLAHVQWERALKTMLDMHGLIMQRDKDIIKVLTPEEVEDEPLRTQIFTLGYTNASETKGIIRNLLTERGNIDIDTATNKMVITDVPTRFQDIERVINELDKQTQQILIEVKVFEDITEDKENIGLKWDFMDELKLGVEDVSRSYTKSQFRVIDSTERRSFTQTFNTTADDFDKKSKLDEGLGMVESSEVRKAIGEEGTTPEATFRHIIKTATLSPADFELTISALFEDAGIHIISHPRLTTVDNKPAMIKVVEQRPIPMYTYNSETGQFEINGFEFKDIGIVLYVTPHINKDGYITLDIEPVVSKSDSVVRFVSSGSVAEIPIIDLRTAITRIIIRSGETLVIGGLMTSGTNEVITKVPLLGDIPVINVLFKHKSTTINHNDLMIFITPTIVSESIADVGYGQPAGATLYTRAPADGPAPQMVQDNSGVDVLTIESVSRGMIYSRRAD